MTTLLSQQQSQSRHRFFVMSLIVLVWNLSWAQALMISEIMYNPPDETLEFIELYNPRAVIEDLSGFAFTNGIQYEFPPNTFLGAKAYLVVALDPNALAAAYDITNVYGPFTGKLSNQGERIELSNANGEIILSLRYNDAYPWPVCPDGTGHSLVLKRPGADP